LELAKSETVDLWAYYSNADEVELFVNDKSYGIKKKEKDVYHVSWRVTFEPGTVRVVSRKNGKEVLSRELHTAGEPARIKLSADRNSIKADGVDLSFVTVDILDRDGNLCPHADNLVKFEVDGAAFVSGVDNGSPISSESFKKPERKAFYGKCLVVLQNNTAQGEITLKATSAGLQEGTLTLEAR
jgi:beta-galactosidase